MTHVGIKRFAAGECEEHRAQYRQRLRAVHEQKVDGMARVHGSQHLGLLHHLPQARCREHAEPQQHDRPEYLANHPGALALDREQPDQNDDRDRNYEARHSRCLHLQSLDSRQHRDRRRDQAVAVEHGRAEQPQRAERSPQQRMHAAPLDRLACERLQGQNAALTVVIGTQHEHDVLEGDHHHQTPEDQRQQAQHRFG